MNKQVINIKYCYLYNEGDDTSYRTKDDLLLVEIGKYKGKINWNNIITITKSVLDELDQNLEVKVNNDTPEVIIAFTTMINLNNALVFNLLSKRKSFYQSINDYRKDPRQYVPVILIGLMNIMEYYNDVDNVILKDRVIKEGEIIERKKYQKNAYNIFKLLNLDSRFCFWDSSIWFRYVPFTQYFRADFLAVAKQIFKSNRGIYQTVVAKEFLEFDLRLLANSYIDSIEGSHAPYVTPFAFHSESRMKSWADKQLELVGNLGCRILVIDDYAADDLKVDDKISPKKHIRIKDLLIEDFCQSDSCDHRPEDRLLSFGKIEIHYVDNIKDAKDLLGFGENQDGNQNYYDIILIDYLFSRNKIHKEDIEYGYNLIKELCDTIRRGTSMLNQEDEFVENTLGPLKKLWFLPISVYANALSDKLMDLGIPTSHEYWVIDKGADPVNMPHLFRFKLYNMMVQQLDLVAEFGPIEYAQIKAGEIEKKKKPEPDTDLNDENKKEILTTYNEHRSPRSKVSIYMQNMILAYNKNKVNTNAGEMYFCAMQIFPKIVELGVFFKRLWKYKDRSPFAKSVIKRFFFGFDLDTWDCLQRLIYMLTNSTAQQKDEMWQDYNYIRTKIKLILEKENLDDDTLKDLTSFNEAILNIGKYISSL